MAQLFPMRLLLPAMALMAAGLLGGCVVYPAYPSQGYYGGGYYGGPYGGGGAVIVGGGGWRGGGSGWYGGGWYR